MSQDKAGLGWYPLHNQAKKDQFILTNRNNLSDEKLGIYGRGNVE